MFSQISFFKDLMTRFTASPEQLALKTKVPVTSDFKAIYFSESELELKKRAKEWLAREELALKTQDPFLDILSAENNDSIYLLSYCLLLICSNESSIVPLNRKEAKAEAQRQKDFKKVADKVLKLFAKQAGYDQGFRNNLIKIQISIINGTKHSLLVKAAPFAKKIFDPEKQLREIVIESPRKERKEVDLMLFRQPTSEEMNSLNAVDPITAGTVKAKLDLLAACIKGSSLKCLELGFGSAVEESKSFFEAFCKPTKNAVTELSTCLWVLYSVNDNSFSMSDEDTSLDTVKALFVMKALMVPSFRSNLLTIKDSIFQKEKVLLEKSTAPFALDILSEAGKWSTCGRIDVELAGLAAAVQKLGANLFLDLSYPEIKESKSFLESLCWPTKEAIENLSACLISCEVESMSFLKELFIEKAIMDPRFKNNLFEINHAGLKEGATDSVLIRGAILVYDLLEEIKKREIKKPEVEVALSGSLGLRP